MVWVHRIPVLPTLAMKKNANNSLKTSANYEKQAKQILKNITFSSSKSQLSTKMYKEDVAKLKFQKQVKNKQPAKIQRKPLKTSEFRLFPATLVTLPDTYLDNSTLLSRLTSQRHHMKLIFKPKFLYISICIKYVNWRL